MRRTLPLLAALLLAAPACEYDPPPEVALELPDDGKWYPDTPLELTFTEAVDPATLELAVWPSELDIEGDIAADVAPVVTGCSPESSPCAVDDVEGLHVVLSEDRTSATVTQGGTFLGREGKPHILVVAAGLADDAGRPRQVDTWLPFQISPTPTSGLVEIETNSDVCTLTADLTDILPGVYLRMFMHLLIDSDGGGTSIIATVAGLDGDYPPNTDDPDHIQPKLDDTGWTVPILGTFTPLDEGSFFLDTDVIDLSVKVLGLIPVTLEGFRLEATFVPGGSPEGRDTFEGFMSATQAYMGEGADELALGAVAASWTGFGVFTEDIPEGLPEHCQEDPCGVLVDGGGDCQLVDPWVVPELCP